MTYATTDLCKNGSNSIQCKSEAFCFYLAWAFSGGAVHFGFTNQSNLRELSRMTLTMNDESCLTGCFAGLRVLDFSTTIAGPHCARMLADMGAEVIKVETADGETMRPRPPVRNGCSTAFGQLNVGKKSLVLDLKTPDAIEVIRRLVADADILVENFRPGVMRRLKLDFASLQQ